MLKKIKNVSGVDLKDLYQRDVQHSEFMYKYESGLLEPEEKEEFENCLYNLRHFPDILELKNSKK